MGVARSVAFRLAMSERFESVVGAVPGGRRLSYNRARRYVAGQTLDEACVVARRLLGLGLAVSLDAFGELVTDPAIIAKLAPYHIWKDSEIEQRFQYDDIKGVNLAFVRIYRLEPEWTFPDAPKYGGCRSWLTFPDLPEGTKLVPVLDDATHAERGAAVQEILKG